MAKRKIKPADEKKLRVLVEAKKRKDANPELQWRDIANQMNEEGFRNSEGRELTPRYFTEEISRHREQVDLEILSDTVMVEKPESTPVPDEPEDDTDFSSYTYEGDETPAPNTPKPAEPVPCDTSSEYDNPQPTLTVSDIEEIARRICRDMMNMTRMMDEQRPALTLDDDVPPMPSARGQRPLTRRTFSIDERLWDCFELERKRLNVDASRLIQILMWRGLNRPDLGITEADAEKQTSLIEMKPEKPTE